MATDEIKDATSEHHDETIGLDSPNKGAVSQLFSQSDDEEDFDWTPRLLLHLCSMYLGTFSVQYMLSMPGFSIAFLAAWDPEHADIVSWVAAIPGVMLCVFALFIGDLSDAFGPRYFMISACALGTVGSFVLCRASDTIMAIGGMIPAGMGVAIGALTVPSLAEAVPKRSRAYVMGLAALLNGMVIVLGSLITGAAMENNWGGQNEGWRIGFYIGAGVFSLAFIFCVFFFHPAPRANPSGLSRKERIYRVDWIGLFIGSASLTFLLVGLRSGGGQFEWDSPTILILLILGVVLLVLFGVWEKFFTKYRLVPAELFVNRNFTITLGLAFLLGLGAFTMTAFVTQVVLSLMTSSYLTLAIYLLPFSAGAMFGAMIVAGIIYATRECRWVGLGSAMLMTLGGGLFALINPGSGYVVLFFPCLFAGLAVGAIGATMIILASISAPNHLIGTSITLVYSVQGFGGAIGIVMFSQILMSKVNELVPARTAAAAIGAGLPPTSVERFLLAFTSRNTTLFQEVPGISLDIVEASTAAYLDATADSFCYIWFAFIPFSALVIIMTLFIESTKHLMTKEVVYQIKGAALSSEEKDLA